MIDSYNLKRDEVDVIGQEASFQMLTTYLQTSDIVAGTSYSFTVRAHNAHGWGPESPPFTIVAASVPMQPTAPSTSISNIYVKVSWVAPDNGSSAISAYKIFIADSTGTFSQEVTYCNGAAEPVLS